jgi:serine/threonine-protein kinase
MGIVYEGWDPDIGRRVAIKTVRLLNDSDPEARDGLARFKNEAQAAGRLSHPNIVAVYDYCETDQAGFIVMEFIDGYSLKERLDAKEPIAVYEAVRLMEQVLAGLQFSHDKGVIHRDIKPSNVMMTIDGQVKLADFGIARIESSNMTEAGIRLGTPAYMSPEQLMADSVDARSDVYSSGVLLYQLLTGRCPFEGSLVAITYKALNTTPLRPSEISVSAPAKLDAVVACAMARQPADRYASAAAFAHALREAYGTATVGLPEFSGGLGDDATVVAKPSHIAARPVGTALPIRMARETVVDRARLLCGAAIVLIGLIGSGAWFVLRPPLREPIAPIEIAPSDLPTGPPINPLPPPRDVANLMPTSDTPVPRQPPLTPIGVGAMRDALGSLAGSLRCTIPHIVVADDGSVSVSGLVGVGPSEIALREAVQDAAPGASLVWDPRRIDIAYCQVLDIIQPISLPTSPFLGLALQDNATHLKSHDLILPILKLPEFPAYLVVDYVSHDGSVAHLYPIRGTPNLAFSGNASIRLGVSARDKIEVGPPFGIDLILALASSVQLFPSQRVREDETVQTYLPALQAAIDAAQRLGATLTGRVLAVETVEQ